MKASVYRPGPFSPRLTATATFVVVSAPAEDESEEGDAIIVERQWDFQLRYLISINGRHFAVSDHEFASVIASSQFFIIQQGADIPWGIQLMPLTKMTIHRITIVLEGTLGLSSEAFVLFTRHT